MSKFATKPAGALGTTGEVTTTHEGGTGFVREPKAELYLAAVSTRLEPTFYEAADERENRIVALTRTVVSEDPQWVLDFVTWLRGSANMRSVSIVVAASAVKARLEDGETGLNRQLVKAACLRADEPGEFIAYWQTRYGRNLPMPVKRGVADAARKSFNQRSALRYDGSSGAMRLGDVVELTHPSPSGPEQSALFGWLLDRRHARRETPAGDLSMLKAVSARLRLNELPIADRHAFARSVLAGEPDAEFVWLQALAGQWEWGRSWLGQDGEDTTFERVSDADQWKLFIQHGMGYMAMLRNLNNFDKAGIADDVVKHVSSTLSDRDEVARSRQFPFRFFSAFKATGGGRWAPALAQGVEYSMANVPSLGGYSLILADMSGSMFPYSYRGRDDAVSQAEQAALFSVALGLRAERADVVQFGTGSEVVPLNKSTSLFDHMAKFHSMGGTQTMEAVRRHFRKGEHTRVIIITDEQAAYDRAGGLDTLVPAEVPIYTWNVAGYRAAHGEAGPTRHSFGGLTDQSWGLIPQIEVGVEQAWPWEK